MPSTRLAYAKACTGSTVSLDARSDGPNDDSELCNTAGRAEAVNRFARMVAARDANLELHTALLLQFGALRQGLDQTRAARAVGRAMAGGLLATHAQCPEAASPRGSEPAGTLERDLAPIRDPPALRSDIQTIAADAFEEPPVATATTWMQEVLLGSQSQVEYPTFVPPDRW